MEWVDRTLKALVGIFVYLADLALAVFAAIELWLRGELQAMGLAPVVQTIILVAVAVLLVLAALNLLGGLIRVLVVLFLVLLAVHILVPLIPA